MSKNSSKLDANQLSFQLSVNLHYGAFNLLLQSFKLLREIGLVSKSESERFDKFVQFYQNLLFRGSSKIYPETVKSPENGNSQS